VRSRGLLAPAFSAHDELKTRTGNFAGRHGPSDGLFGDFQLAHGRALGGRHRSERHSR
jgi:hypothetical protein